MDAIFLAGSLARRWISGDRRDDRRICPRTGFDPLVDLRHPQFQRTDLVAKRALILGLPPSGQMQG